MIYITGDTHGKFDRYKKFAEIAQPREGDVMIVLGDAGLNYYGRKRDEYEKEFVNSFPFTTFCVHGNHENRPHHIHTYQTKEFHGGIVWYEEKFPNIVFAKDGEVYDFDGYQCIVIGGAYSVDKYYRLQNGWMWFPDEQPSEEIKAYVEEQLASRDYKIDILLSHTCPLKYEPVEMFISGLDQSTIDKSTEIWLDEIESKLSYDKWYCGHYHTVKKIDKMQFMYENIDVLCK